MGVRTSGRREEGGHEERAENFFLYISSPVYRIGNRWTKQSGKRHMRCVCVPVLVWRCVTERVHFKRECETVGLQWVGVVVCNIPKVYAN